MTNQPNSLACKFTTQIEQERGRYVVEIPEAEIDHGTLSPGDICQISVQHASEQQFSTNASPGRSPPVSIGERRTVQIEGLGDKGDGIARVDRGYVLIVPDTEPGDEVTVEVRQIESNYGFAEPVEEEENTI